MKKKILLLTSLMSLSCIAIGTITIISNYNFELVNSYKSPYTITLDKDHKVQNYLDPSFDTYATGSIYTDMGSRIDLRLSPDISHYIAADCFIDFTSTSLEAEHNYIELANPVNGLLKMEYEANCDLTIEVGYSLGNYIGTDTIHIDGNMTSGTYIFDSIVSEYRVPPSYMKLSTNKDTASHIIKSLKFYFTCSPSGDPTTPVGTYLYEDNNDIPGQSITITDFSMDGSDVPEGKVLFVPEKIDNKVVTRINEGVYDNVPWVEYLHLPFVGGSKYLETEGYSHNFASIFGENKAHIQYRPIQQKSSASGYEIWYIPKSLHSITVNGCNIDIPGFEEETSIPDYAFYGCNEMIDKIELNCDFVRIGDGAFGNCSALTDLLLPNSCSTVGTAAFAGCSNLFIRCEYSDFNLDLDNVTGNPDYRPYTYGYQKTIEIDNIIYDVVKNSDQSLSLVVVGVNPNATDITIPKSLFVDDTEMLVARITNRAMEGMTNLRIVRFDNFEIRPTDNYIGHFAFKDCYKATFLIHGRPSELQWPSDWNMGAGRAYENFLPTSEPAPTELLNCSYYMMEEDVYADPTDPGVFYTGVSDELGSNFDFYTVTKELESMLSQKEYRAYFPSYAFEGDSRVTRVEIPRLTCLPHYSFSNCANLESVYYHGSEEEWNALKSSGYIGANVFFNTSITTVFVLDNSGNFVEIPL